MANCESQSRIPGVLAHWSGVPEALTPSANSPARLGAFFRVLRGMQLTPHSNLQNPFLTCGHQLFHMKPPGAVTVNHAAPPDCCLQSLATVSLHILECPSPFSCCPIRPLLSGTPVPRHVPCSPQTESYLYFLHLHLQGPAVKRHTV